ncbi:MAG: hypothetical protein J5510_08615 [Prevotella sp.]|nr:hypothetical protein [Prevotella sp.]
MADAGKLWFEMGVRENVTNSLGEIIKEGQRAAGVIDELVMNVERMAKIDIMKHENGKALKDAQNYQQMLLQIEATMSKINEKQLGSTVGTDKLQKAFDILNRFRAQLGKMEGNGDEWTGDMMAAQQRALRNAMVQVNQLLREQAAEQRQADQATRNAEKSMRQQEKANRDAARAAQENARANRDLVAVYDRLNEAQRSNSRIMDQIQSQWQSYVSIYGAERLLHTIITIGGEFEQQHIALQQILGDIDNADRIFNQIQELAVVSPFNFRQLVSYTKQTAAYGIPYEELYDTTKRLADLSAGLGVDMNRLVLAYGQVRSAAVLRGQELRQFTEAGIPLVQKLADKFTQLNGRMTTTADVFELISRRKVPFEMVRDVLWDMTNKGGSFYNIQYKLSDTLLGKWSNLRDAWEIMLGNMAEGDSFVGGFLKKSVQGVTDLIGALDRLSPMLMGLLAGFGVKRLGGSIIGGTSRLKSTILDAKEQEAARLQREALYRDLNDREKDILNTRKQITINDVSALASAGRLNTLKLQQLYVSKQINVQDVARLANERIITLEQAKQITNAKTYSVIAKSIGASIGGFAKNLWATLTGPGMLVSLGVSAVASSIFALKKANEEQVDMAKKTAENISEQYNKVLEVQQKISKGDITTMEKGDLLKGVNEMTEALKSTDAYTRDVSDHVNKIDDLAEKYKYLKSVIDETSESYELLSKSIEATTLAAIEMTDGDWDESIISNAKDVNESMTEFDKAAVKIQSFSGILEKEIGDVAGEGGKELADMLDNADGLREKLKILADSGHWDDFATNVSQVSTEAYLSINKFKDAYDSFNKDMKTLIGEDVPAFTEGIVNAFRDAHPNVELTDLDANLIKEMKKRVHEAIKAIPGIKQELKDQLEEEMYATMRVNWKINIFTDLSFDIPTPPDYWRTQSPILNQVYGKVTGAGHRLGDNFYNNLVEHSGTESGLWDYMDKQVGSLKKDADAAKKLFGETSDEYKNANKAYMDMLNARNDAFGGSYSDSTKKPKKKGGGGSKKDEALERAKTELDSIKNFLAEFKKYKEVYGREKSLSLLEEIFKLPKGRGKEIVDDYKGQLKKVLDALPLTSEARKKFGISVNKLIADFDLDQAKEDIQKALKQIERIIQEETNQWNLYKSLLEKTGSKDFAMSAFVDGIKWDDMTRSMAAHLREAMNGQNKVMGEGIWDIDEDQAEEFFGKGTAELKQWQEIVKNIRKNWTDSLNEVADATAALLTDEEKIKKIEDEIADLRRKGYDDHSTVILKKILDLEKARTEAFKHSSEYLKFYESILSMTIPEAEEIGQKIRRNLNQELKMGTITAKQYTQEVKRINDQMKKLREHATGLRALIDGGLNGLFQGQYDRAESNFNRASIDYQKAAEAYQTALKNGDDAGAKQAQSAMKAAEAMQDGAGAAMQGAQGAMNTVMIIDKIIHGINDAVQGIKGTFEEIKEMYDYMGKNTESDGWQESSAFLSAFSSASQNATNAWDSLKNGNMGGVIQGVVGSFTSWYTGLAKGWDNKMDRQIKIAQEHLNETERLRKSIESSLERTLGGVYNYKSSDYVLEKLTEARNRTEKVDEKTYLERARDSIKKGFLWSGIGSLIGGPLGAIAGGLFGNIFGAGTKKYKVNYYSGDTMAKMEEAIASQSYYDEQLALLYKQRDELSHQLKSEQDKKKSDSEKIEDYKDKIAEVKEQIKTFALDMAKALYEIDLHGWAKTLTDAIVGAWEKGENAVTAYRNAVKDMMKDLTTNILAKKVMERAFETLGIDDLITELMDATNGLLDENSIGKIADRLNQVGDLTANAITGVLDVLEAKGYIDKGNSSGSGSGANAIKSITEDQTNLLLSYINAMRADLSIHVERVRQMMEDVMPGMSGQFALQLAELKKIEANTHRSADGVDKIYSLLDSMSTGIKKLSVKAYA